MKTIALPLDKIESNPKNYRENYQGTEKLADSIGTYGLLQNLVIWEYEPGKYHVKAGERRLRALRLLKERKHPYADEPIRCVLLSEFTIEDVIENEQRKKVASWELGARFYDMYEQGFSQLQISVKTGTTPTIVSYSIKFFRFIHPRVKALLSRQGPDCVSIGQLQRLSSALDEGAPDEAKQLELLEKFLDERTKPKRETTSEQVRRERINFAKRARTVMEYNPHKERVPLHVRPVLIEIQEFLRGERKKFRFR